MTTIPTFTAIRDSIIADLEAEYSISILLRPFLYIWATIQASKFKLIYLLLGQVQKNVAPDTCDEETLIRFGMIKLGRPPRVAVQAQYEIDITMTATGTIAAGVVFKSDESSTSPGKLYILDTDFVYSGVVPGVVPITVRALEAGVESRLTAGDTMTATAPIAISEGIGVWSSVVVAPLAAEDIEDYRQTVLQGFRLEAQGGSAADIRLWGLDAAGVKQIYPYAKSGAPNEIDVFVEATKPDSTDGRGTPGSTILTDVAACIELDPDTTLSLADRGRRPLGVYAVNVQAITLKAIGVTITGYVGRTTSTDAILAAAIGEVVDKVRPFIGACDDPTLRNDIISRNSIIQAVMAAIPTSVFTDIELQVDSVALINYQVLNGNIPYLSFITYA